MKIKIITLIFLILGSISCKRKKENKKIASKIETNYTNNNQKTLKERVDNKNSVINAYLDDSDKSGTNIRNKPKGKIILVLNKNGELNDYEFLLVESKNGWFKIKSPISAFEGEDIELPNNEGWIHGSVISVHTRNYGKQHLKLIVEPNSSKVITTIKEEAVTLKLIELKNEWVKVKYNGHIGWIKKQWLCGNPVTYCN